MASTEELEAQILAEMESNPEAYADTEIEYCTVDDDTRVVTVPEKYRKLGVESDEAAKRIWFRFPKLVGNNGVDLSAIGVRVNFRNANGEGDIYIVEDLTTDGDYVTFSWELTRKVTAYKGNVSFVVCAVKSNTDGTTKNEWNTTLNKECEVLEGLEVTEQIEQENPDIIEYILANLGGSVSAEQIAQAVEEYLIGNPPSGMTADEKAQLNKNTEDISQLSEEKVNNPSIGEIGQILEIETVDENGKPKTYKAVDKPIGGGEVSPQWAEFPRETNPSRDIYNRTAMDNAFELGTSGTLRHNALVEGELITWTESTTSSDTASGSSGGVDVKIKHVYDYFGTAHKQADPWESNHIRYTDDITVFPSGESIYGADGSIIDTVIATSDSTIIDIGSSNYIILAYCRGNSDYHMIYRTASISSHTIALGETINVLKINGVEWDMTTLRSDYTNKLSQLNTKVINVSNVYYMAVVQSKVGIAIMKSSDGIDWSLHAHIADEDAYLEACLGCVSWASNNMPTYYLVVRHQYCDGYLTLYGSNFSTFEKIISKVFIPAATGRAIIDSKNNKEAYLIYSVNGRKNAVLAKILPNSDGTTGISLLETPDNCISNYPCIYVSRSLNNTYSAFIVGTNGINKNNCSVSVSYIWINNTDIEKEKNEQIKKVMFGTSVEVIQTLTEGTEIGSVGGTKLYAPKASSSSGGGDSTLELLGTATVSEDTGRVDFEFETALNLKKIIVYAHTIGVSDFNAQARGTVYVNDKLVSDGIDNAAFNSGAEKYMLFDIDVLQDCTIGRSYLETYMGSGYSSDRVGFLMKTDINENTNIVKISFKANQFDSVAIASGTTVSVYGY